MDQVALTQGVVADVCAGSQSATHAMGMLGVRSIPIDERTHVDTGWGTVHNEYVELNVGFEDDPGTSAYEQMRDACHSRGLAVGRLNAAYISLDCKPNIMDAQAKGKYRDKKGKPLLGPDGDLARSCDDQLLDVFRAVKRIAEERKLLTGQRDRKREHELDAVYDASTDDEAERHVGAWSWSNNRVTTATTDGTNWRHRPDTLPRPRTRVTTARSRALSGLHQPRQ